MIHQSKPVKQAIFRICTKHHIEVGFEKAECSLLSPPMMFRADKIQNITHTQRPRKARHASVV